MLPATAALFSSGVPLVRLLEANFGTSARVMTRTTRPLLVRITLPFASGPYGSVLLPPWSRTLDTIVQAPWIWPWSEPVCCLLPAWDANATSATAARFGSAILRMVFMGIPPGRARRQRDRGGPQHAPGKIATRPGLLAAGDAEQLDLEDERGAARDGGRVPVVAVGD